MAATKRPSPPLFDGRRSFRLKASQRNRTMRNTLRASVLALALSCPTFVGDIPCPVVSPTPLPANVSREMTFGGEVLTPPTPDDDAQDGAAAAALALFEVVLNLLALS
jgi:hypothetical protein